MEKRRISFLLFVFAVLFGALGVFGAMELAKSNNNLIAQAEGETAYLGDTANTNTDKHIDFDLDANYTKNYNNDTMLIDANSTTNQVTITYKINYNDGVNSLILVPTYDKEVFEIAKVEGVYSINYDNTSLGTPTITGTDVSEDKIRLAFESETTYGDTNAVFVQIVYNVKAPADGEFVFSLELPPVSPETHNTVSEAYYWLDGTSVGEQEEVEVRIVETAIVKILTIKTATIEIGYNENATEELVEHYIFRYAKTNATTAKVDDLSNTEDTNLVVYYTYVGSDENYAVDPSAIVVTWYVAEPLGNGEYTKGTALDGAPRVVGNYIVSISANAAGVYSAVGEVTRLVIINPQLITVKADNKTSQYGDAIVELTYTVEGTVFDGDSLVVTITTEATTASPVGDYDIEVIAGVATEASEESMCYRVQTYGATYTITARQITITANNQSAVYTGSEPEVDQTKWTVTSGSIITGDEIVVTLTKAAGVNVGSYAITPSASHSNYTITFENGTFTITSVNVELAQYFAGKTLVFNGNEQDLLEILNTKPEWLPNSSISAQNNIQTNVTLANDGKYTITVTITLDQTTADNYVGGQTETVFTVEGKITPYALTIEADDKTNVYGSSPEELTPATVGLNNELQVSYTVMNNDEPIVLAAGTPVGTYQIVPSTPSNVNYTITYANGTYTVTKASIKDENEDNIVDDTDEDSETPADGVKITVGAEDIYYNRDLATSAKVMVGRIVLDNSAYTIVIKDAQGNEVNALVPDAGEYTVEVQLAETANYAAATKTATFNINKIALANTTVSYNKTTATWTAVTADAGAKELYNSTLTYAINGVAKNGLSYTANSTDALTLTISSSNPNYIAVTKELEPVYSVEFAEGSHPNTLENATNMPQAQFVFAGQTATEPSEIPAVTGYTFDKWDYNFATLVNENKTIVALWNINTYIITFKYTDDAQTANTDVFTFELDYNSKIAYAELNLAPVKSSDNAGISYQYNGEWISNLLTYIVNNNGNLENENVEYIVTGNATFVAQYNTIYNEFTVTYYVRENGGNYSTYGQQTTVTYLDEIPYTSLSTNIHWFTANAWYSDENVTQVAPVYMPAENINVYGEIVFNVGQGDVNGDGLVDTNDIMLYRQWIVGGYTMTVVASGNEWATAHNYNAETRYFLMRVADNNTDLSNDIRDVSITRMAIVGGYSWDINEGLNVTGQEISRNARVSTLEALLASINAGNQATLMSDITDTERDLTITSDKNISINLNGKTLTLKSASFNTTNGANIIILNGNLVTTDGITISAPNGDVILTNLVGYDENGVVNLQAGSNSMHINGTVEFKKGDKTQNVPAEVNIEKGTHIVIEENANIVVEKLVVTNNFVQSQDANDVISIDNYSAVTTEITVEGNVENKNAIKTLNDLVTAMTNGGSYILMADITYSGTVGFTADTVLDLNGYALRSTNSSGVAVCDGATLTINGNGNVYAQEASVLVLDGSKVIINGGTFTSTDNFVVGTNGSTGKGNNTITINGGVFNGNITSAGYVACGIYVANSDTVVVNGGTFNITNGVGILARSGNTTVAEEVVFNVTGNGTLGKVGDSKVTVPAGKILVQDLAANYPGGEPTLTNNSEYEVCVIAETVADINAVKNTAKVIMLGNDITNASNIVFSKSITLDLNGHSISFNSWGIDVVSGATLTICGNGNVEAVEACVVAQAGGKLIINGGTFTSKDNFVIGTQGSAGNGGNTITINAGTFNGRITSAGYVACGIYVANSDTVVVNGGTFNITNGVGVVARSGNTTIGANVVFNVTGNGTLGKVGDSRVVLPAGAVLVQDFEANYPGGAPTLTNNSEYEVTTIIETIDNLAELKVFRDAVNAGDNFAGKTVTLNANITLDGAWTPISNYSRKDTANQAKWFAGTFDGNNHTISGLTNNGLTVGNINNYEEYTYGLFGSVNNAVIKNLTLTNVAISANTGDSLGALVGYVANSTQKAEANISNITVNGSIAGLDNVGGVVGRAAGTYFKALNVTVSGAVTADLKAAGIVGTGNAQEMVFENCTNNANVSSTVVNSNAGYNAVAGISITWGNVCKKVVMTNCANSGEITTVNANAIAGELAADYSPKTDMNANGTWTYASGHWTNN